MAGWWPVWGLIGCSLEPPPNPHGCFCPLLLIFDLFSKSGHRPPVLWEPLPPSIKPIPSTGSAPSTGGAQTTTTTLPELQRERASPRPWGFLFNWPWGRQGPGLRSFTSTPGEAKAQWGGELARMNWVPWGSPQPPDVAGRTPVTQLMWWAPLLSRGRSPGDRVLDTQVLG